MCWFDSLMLMSIADIITYVYRCIDSVCIDLYT